MGFEKRGEDPIDQRCNMAQETRTKIVSKIDAFASVAFWQFMSFFLLISFVWVEEKFDLTALVFDTDPTPFNVYRALLLTSVIILAGVIAVGNTYEKQRSLVKRLLMSCAYCHRVKTDDGSWMHVEDFFLTHYPIGMDRGVCADCDTMLKTVGEKSKNLLEDA
jgi:hypothetical protein